MYVIKCLVTGGKTGTRKALLKCRGVVIDFDTYEVAFAKAEALQRRRRQKQYSTPPFFSYTVQATQQQAREGSSICDSRSV